MARPRKVGLDYFPLDVDVFEDDKLFDVQTEYGTLGEAVFLRLLCLVYKNGYYFKFDSIEKLAALVIRSIGSRWVDNKRQIVEIISFIVKCGLFSEKLFERNILTSKGVQTRFKLAAERRKSGIIEFNLLENPDASFNDTPAEKFSLDDKTALYNTNKSVNNSFDMADAVLPWERNAESNGLSSNNEDFCCNNPTKNSKVNESKANESKADESKLNESKLNDSKLNVRDRENVSANSETYFEATLALTVTKSFNNICKSLPKITRLTTERVRAIVAASNYIETDFEDLFRRVESSDFLSGRNGKWQYCTFDWVLRKENIAKINSGFYDNKKVGKMEYEGVNNRSEYEDRQYCEEVRRVAMLDYE